MDEIKVPELDDDRVLRHVALGSSAGEYRLLLWEARDAGGMPLRAKTGQWRLGYAFYAPGTTEPLFVGEDYGCSPMDAIDSDEAVRGILGFLTLRPGDTDSDYFAGYTEAQHAFSRGDAEELSMWSVEPEEGEEPMPLREID